MESEISLSSGRTTPGVVRIGDTVRRPITGQSTFVHELLNHLERRGFAGAPRFLGIDRAGREILSFIPGSVPPELGAFSDDQLTAAARLLRRLHDATLGSALRDGHEVVCHGDASPCNCVFVEGIPAAFIDFDAAHPGSRIGDLGYAAWLWIDIGNDELSADLQGTRIADFFRIYGMDSARAIDAITLAQTALSERTDSSGVREWSSHCRAWVERNRDALSAAITTRSNAEADRLQARAAQLLAALRGAQAEDAVCAIRELPSEALLVVAEGYRRESEGARRQAIIRALWNSRNPAVLSTLESALNDSDDRVWKEALDGLVTLGGNEVLQILESAQRALAVQPESLERGAWVNEALEQVRRDLGSNGKR